MQPCTPFATFFMNIRCFLGKYYEDHAFRGKNISISPSSHSMYLAGCPTRTKSSRFWASSFQSLQFQTCPPLLLTRHIHKLMNTRRNPVLALYRRVLRLHIVPRLFLLTVHSQWTSAVLNHQSTTNKSRAPLNATKCMQTARPAVTAAEAEQRATKRTLETGTPQKGLP